MAKHYGDIPCVKIDNQIHVTSSATACLCGMTYMYGTTDREGKARNIIWREPDAITCETCRNLYQQKN